jgi:alpha/beta superfamily hydrolase
VRPGTDPPGASGAGPSRLFPVTIDGPAGPLEGLLQEPDTAEPTLSALVCHPHPKHGGTLHNKVVHRAAATLRDHGAAVLRFNFRGVGASAGVYDDGIGELEDARAALAFLRSRHPGTRLWLAGFSFGSWIAARLAVTVPETERLILIAPPVVRQDFTVMRDATVRKHVIQGTVDDICTPEALEVEYAKWPEPKRRILVEGGTHFFDKRLDGLARAVAQAFE